MAEQKANIKLRDIEFCVLPNTGHQYMFIPFEKAFLSKYDTQERLITRQCTANHKPWRQYTGPGPDGKQRKFSWIRYRYGSDDSQTPGIWLAVETNVGSVKRGSFFDRHEVVSAPENRETWSISPYAYQNEGAICQLEAKDSYDVLLTVPNPAQPSEQLSVARIQIIWQKSVGHTDVDLVVDFGNTRTVVLALENNASMAHGKLNSVCFPILFLPRGYAYPGRSSEDVKKTKHNNIADSWFLLQEPAFSESDIPIPGVGDGFQPSCEYSEKKVNVNKGGLFGGTTSKIKYIVTERVPQMFVEISPVIMGEEAGDLLSNVDLSQGQNISMSSPKRYLWDKSPCGDAENSLVGMTPWCMNPNPWSNRKRRDCLQALAGQICRYMYMDGRDWPINQPPFEEKESTKRPVCIPERPVYPRASAMVWSALSILESAHRQITSYNWRKGNNPFVKRRLRSVNVTYPSGWIKGELDAYRQAWKQAVDIFTLAHFESREEVRMSDSFDAHPLLRVELDEAVASQLPFIYSEIRRLANANTWIKLYGRPAANGDIVRVMTIDIGGGTMDSSIVEYRNCAPGAQVSLRYKVLFRDCNSFAGDSVMLSLIQRALLPSILGAKGIDDEDDDIAVKFTNILMHQRDRQVDRAKWQRITKMFFLPVVRQWLTDVANCPGGIYEGPDGQMFRTVQSLIEDCGVDEQAIVEFNEYLQDGGLDANFIDLDDRLMYKPEIINDCIQERLEYGIVPLGKFISAYDVDLVTLSGKISEMPKVSEMLCQTLPLCSQRIVRMKDYMAGDWYPMSDNGRIQDAKTVTAVGAALFIAGKNSLVDNWTLSPELTSEKGATKNYWGITKSDNTPGFGDIPFLAPQETSNEHKSFVGVDGATHQGSSIMANQYIGRQKYNSTDAFVEQQYILKWKGKDENGNLRPHPASPLAVVFERVDADDDDIRIVSVEATAPEETVSLDDVELMLCTLPPQGFWMDECRFNTEFE